MVNPARTLINRGVKVLNTNSKITDAVTEDRYFHKEKTVRPAIVLSTHTMGLGVIRALGIIEHVIHVDHFIKEIHRILSDEGYLYMSAPNYGSLAYLPRFLLTGKTFHDPLSKSSVERYEFYAHVRYFTYRSLVEFVSSFGFVPDTVYLALPEGSSHYRSLPKPKAMAFRYAMMLMYNLFSPRWAAEPIICFQKASSRENRNFRKVIL